MFDLGIGVVRAKLLNDKVQGDGYPDHKDRRDFVKKAVNILGSQLWKNAGKKLGETPMRMLIAQELPSAIELKDKTPNIVAKLMGLNSLPTQHRISACKRKSQKPHPRRCRALEDWRQEEVDCNQMKCRGDFHTKKYKDVFEVKNKSSSIGQLHSENIHLEDCRGGLLEKRMALVHQKFIEAKRLATNERLLQSKEFKDAVEVLNSNRDLFLKLLEDPICFSSKLQELHQTTTMETQTKNITVLKPMSIDTNHEKGVKKNLYACAEDIRDISRHDLNSCLYLPKNEIAAQSTKIVVLKACSEMPLEAQAGLVSHNSLAVAKTRSISGNLRTDEDMRSTEQYNEFTHTIQKGSRSTHKDDYQRSPALCNGYIADESSLSLSETDCREGGSDCSEFESAAPTSHNSWVHMRSDNPGSPSSFSPVSRSHESSVSREAKKRMSKRLESVTSNRIVHEQESFSKSSCTLGEMLAIPEIKKEEEGAERLDMSRLASCDQEHGEGITYTSSSSDRMHESNKDCPMNFARSTSPISLPNKDITTHESNYHELSSKSIIVKKLPKMKNENSFKGKVSDLIFSSMKKLRVKPNFSFSSPHHQLHFASSSVAKNDKVHMSSLNGISDEITTSKNLEESFFMSSSPIFDRRTEKHGNVSLKGTYTVEKLWKHRSPRENSSQGSHVLTSERPHQEDFFFDNASLSSQRAVISDPQALSRSPLISSVSRSLKLENTHFENEQSSSFKLSSLFFKEDAELERLDFITKLLFFSNFANESCNSLLAKINSLNSPLDPILLDEFLDKKEEESKRKIKRSNQRLYFDCVNDALKDICCSALMVLHSWSSIARRTRERAKSNLTVSDAVWCHLNSSFSETQNCSSNKAENSSQYFDNLVRKEVSGIELAESMWFEKDDLSREISEKVLESLLDEALVDLTGWFFS